MNLIKHFACFCLVAIVIHWGNLLWEKHQSKADVITLVVDAVEPSDSRSLNKIIEEQILINEAMRLGLHTHDPVIQERIHKTLDFLEVDNPKNLNQENIIESVLANDVVVSRRLLERIKKVIAVEALVGISDQVIHQYYLENPRSYLSPLQYRLDYRYVITHDGRGATDPALSYAAQQLGNSFYTENNLRKILPKALVEQLTKLTPGQSVQYETAGVMHIVTVKEIQPSIPIPFELIKEKVMEDYINHTGNEAVAAYVARVSDYYNVVIRNKKEQT